MTHRYRDFPVEPLLAELYRRHPDRTGPVSALCKGGCGISGDTAHRWIDEGLAELEADRVAVRLGLHPSALWPDHWWAVHDADQAVVRYQLRERRWVVNWVRRHRFDPCSPPRLPSVAAAGV